MKSQKYTGLIGVVICTILLFTGIAYQHTIGKELLFALLILILYIGVTCWQYTFYGSWKNSALSALRITLIVIAIGAVIGLLKRLSS